MKFLSFSAEASAPAGYFIMKLLNPIEVQFQKDHSESQYCADLSSIMIVFICTSQELKNAGFFKERKYISRKKKYADFRLFLDFEDFLQASDEKKMNMLWEIIQTAIENISSRVPSLKKAELLCDLKTYFIK